MSDTEAIVVGVVAAIFFGVLLGAVKGTSQVKAQFALWESHRRRRR